MKKDIYYSVLKKGNKAQDVHLKSFCLLIMSLKNHERGQANRYRIKWINKCLVPLFLHYGPFKQPGTVVVAIILTLSTFYKLCYCVNLGKRMKIFFLF